MEVQTVKFDQATLIMQRTGLAGSLLTDDGPVYGSGGDGGAFSVYYAVVELKNLEARLKLLNSTMQSLIVMGTPRGKRKSRRFTTTSDENFPHRALILRGWDLPRPPHPPRFNSQIDSEPNQIGLALTSADWNEKCHRVFEDYTRTFQSLVGLAFPIATSNDTA